jgi:hypothetical protein
MFQNDPEFHSHSIVPSGQPLRPARLVRWPAWAHRCDETTGIYQD